MYLRIFVLFCLLSCRNTAPQDKKDNNKFEIVDTTARHSEVVKDTLALGSDTSLNTLNDQKNSHPTFVEDNSEVANQNKVKVKTKINPKKVSSNTKKIETKVQDKDIETSPDENKKVEVSTVDPIKEVPVKDKSEHQIIPPKPDPHPTHAIFQQQLSKYVSKSGKVNYAAWKKDIEPLNQYLNELSSVTINDTWTKNEQLAYWINVYNAFTIKLILQHYPVKSITEIKQGKPWDYKFITIGAKAYSLNDIEKDKIIKRFAEPRIHFAVNCAAKSCPPLSNIAYTKDNLQTLLEDNTRSFINSHHNQIDKNKIQLSKIFEWYRQDFGDIATYIAKYAVTKPNASTKISFLEYDWSLNE